MFYRFCLAVVRFITFFAFRTEALGMENVPAEGGAILAVNHRSNWDVILVGIYCPRMLRFMAKAELFANKLFGGLIRKLGAFPVHRGRGDIGAIKSALDILSKNNVMLMFPEGHRMRGGKRAEHAKTGVAMLASRSKVPVIPVCISGDYKWMRKVTVTFGEPIVFEFDGHKPDSAELQSMSDDVLHRIYALDSTKQIDQ